MKEYGFYSAHFEDNRMKHGGRSNVYLYKDGTEKYTSFIANDEKASAYKYNDKILLGEVVKFVKSI